MKIMILTLLAFTLLSGCSQSVDERADDYTDVSFALCGTNVKAFSQGDDGKIRLICDDESYFSLKNNQTLVQMQEINGAYCLGEGFSMFSERKNYYTFTCKSNKRFNIAK
ncbi:hypothetical protein [Photobacterium indicum]|uniref:hypothetical protein n=1 Tax=Photobacterium indicum TaxID=81447 RepID=UPI003D1261D2